MFEYIFLTGCTVGINWRQCIYDLIFFNLIFCQFNAWSNVINLTSVYYSLTFSIYMKNLMNCENNNKQHIFFSLWNFYNHFIPIYTNKGTSSTPVLLINDDLCHNLFWFLLNSATLLSLEGNFVSFSIKLGHLKLLFISWLLTCQLVTFLVHILFCFDISEN